MKKQYLIFYMLFSCFAYNCATAQINYQWVKSISSTTPNNDIGKSIVSDNVGNIYVTGKFGYGTGAEFNPYGTGSVSISSGGTDCFFAKYDANGDCLWANSMQVLAPGGIGFAIGTGIAVDASNNVYVLGVFKDSVDFDPGAGSFKLNSQGAMDCFFAKYDPSGAFQWVRHFGGSSDDDAGAGIAVDALGTGVYLTGYFKSSTAYFMNQYTVDTTLTNSGDKDAFIAKYGTDGSFKWAKSIGGIGEDVGTAIDASGSYVTFTGSFQNTADFNPGSSPELDTALGFKDVFVSKYFLDGSFGWTKNLGHTGSGNTAIGTGVAIDASNIYLTGVFKGQIDFEMNNVKQAIGQQDIFYAMYHISDELLGYGYNIGSNLNSQTDSASVSDIVVDPAGNIFLTGTFEGKADFNPSQGGDSLESVGKGDIFLAKYDTNGDKIWVKAMGGDSTDVGYGIAVNNAENVYLTGTFQGTVNFDPGAGIANRTSFGSFGTDIFISKYREGTSTIMGTVSHGVITNLVTSGSNSAYLYTETTNDGNAAMHLVETVDIDNTGNYSFSGVCTGNYIVLAIADTLDYPQVAPTYYGDSTHWQQAIHIITLPSTVHTANIIMKEYFPLTGTATISGTVLEGDGFNRVPGDPIPGTDVGLDHDPGGSIVSHTTTDANGKYTFKNLPAGCYKIYVNIPGLPMDSTYHECLDSLDNIPDLNFIADSSSIDINPTPSSVEQMNALKTIIQIYPNPHQGLTNIEFTITETNKVQIDVFNLIGEKVAELLNEQKQAGIVKCPFNGHDKGLTAGVYLLNVKVGDESITKKIIQVE